ncbi:DUF4277 domain-containing protein [Endozoicomonas sp. ONNA2]|uniref:DUF4277 domain-containing protein n=1 Tax=Endozoicomonas sp. ONNA2 TaxID=2828741 RepID=UPI002147761A
MKSDVKGLIRSSGTTICRQVQYQFKNLNHPGLVAAMSRELNIAEYFDARNVTIGQAVVAMIINGVGCCPTQNKI